MGLIRFLLAISVVMAHVGGLPYVGALVGGKLAVQTFFMLSGFYMALVLNEKYTSTKTFYWNRFSRIMTGYWVALIAAILLRGAAGQNLFAEILNTDWTWSAKLLMLISNAFLVGSDWAMFTHPTPEGIQFTANFAQEDIWFFKYLYISPAWSLVVELAFYILAPLLVRSPRYLATAALISLAARAGTYWLFGSGDPWSYRFMPSELIYFALGMAAYRLKPMLDKAAITPVAGIVGVIFIVWLFYKAQWLRYSIGDVRADVSVILLTAVMTPVIFNTTKRLRLDRLMGEISFPIYLIHVPLMQTYSLMTGGAPSAMWLISATIVVSFPLHSLADRADRWLRSISPMQRKNRSGSGPEIVASEISRDTIR